MGMEPKYYAEEVIDTPIISWEYDWMPREQKKHPNKFNWATKKTLLLSIILGG